MSIDTLWQQFPALLQSVGDHPLTYLDSAASTQKPQSVLDAMQGFYQKDYANVHRAAHSLSSRATFAYEAVRDKLIKFVGADSRQQIIFSHGTTSSINMVAHGLTPQINKGDRILVDTASHHANLVPWQALAKRTGAVIEPIAIDEYCRIDLDKFAKQVFGAKVVACAHVSNAIGAINPVQQICQLARAAGAISMVDGAQAISHLTIDIKAIGCDFYAFSGHKMYGPTGIGVLTGKLAALESLDPMLTGGEMIKSVSFTGTEYGPLPNRLEAGTPPIAEVIGLGAAIDFMHSFDSTAALSHERNLLAKTYQALSENDRIEIYGYHPEHIGVLAFNIKGEHHQDVATLLDQQGVAIRAGHHCAMPLMQHLGIKGSCRLSFAAYSKPQDVDAFLRALDEVLELLD
ncbi:aminotransferase class V-fold PLP-dependent enzyme [Paraferrimonas sp. SM1919]|uniref:aminotransferase class V-fold PLP-dependent enzyme n=1 Tax=Paraferrimonas sp. SM1919 TaxID=2662263 RepID=UPI0013D323A4|nr:cysteine desulfurase [Paraferrimonas sp. SM1919]